MDLNTVEFECSHRFCSECTIEQFKTNIEKAEVDNFLNLIADTLQIFEESTDEEIQKIKADQYDPNSETPKLLSADQIRWVLFTVNDSDGYDILAIDAAVNRLSDALEYHWRKSE